MVPITEQQVESFKTFIEKHDSFLIAGHKEPDGDCMACSIGMSYILKHLGKRYTLLNAGPFKRTEIKKFAPLFRSDVPSMVASERAKCGLIIVDCSELSRLGEIDGNLEGLDTFIVDHHLTSEARGFSSIIDATAPAAACLVQQLYEGIVGKPDANEAHTLFFGLATDTGFFRYLNQKDSSVFDCASRLTDAGVNPREIYQEMTGGKPWNTRKLLAIILERAERYCNGKLVVSYEEQVDTRKYGQEGRDSDAFYTLMLSTDGVQAVVFVRQESDTNCTAGFRSLRDCDVSVIASKFGGGGPKNASGASIQGRLEGIIPAIVEEFSKVL